MSDMMRGMPPGGGMPGGMPGGGMPGGMGGAPGGAPGGMDVRSKMSIMNPTDMAAKASRGDVRSQQSVGEFLQKNYGVSPQDPVEKLFAAVKSQAQNATVGGKMGMPQGAAPGGPPGGGMPGGGMPGGMGGGMGGGRPPMNMDELAGRIGG